MWVVDPWFTPPSQLPSILVVVAILGVMALILALFISPPLSKLRKVMDRFGRGELNARVRSRRHDEIGVVSREFDSLADRVEMLVAAERRLLQDVSHELRSPLTRLEVAVDLAMSRPDPRPLLERIRRDVARLSSLVVELLQLSRVESEPAARVVDEIPVGDLLHRIVEDCEIEATALGCQIAIEANAPGTIVGDAELLHRAIENVVRNAMRYSPQGGTVRVSSERSEAGLKICIRDSGSLRRIWSPSSSRSFALMETAAARPAEWGWGWRSPAAPWRSTPA